jgi:hypothetical protein
MELEQARTELKQLQNEMRTQQETLEATTMGADPRIEQLLTQRDQTSRQLLELRKQLKSQQERLSRETSAYNRLVTQFKQEQNRRQQDVTAPAQTASSSPTSTESKYAAYVFVISGSQAPHIEDTLHLKSWVESYGAKYIEASWNGIDSDATSGSLNQLGFQQHFNDYLNGIPENARLILIGHGLGGGAAIEAATRVAYAKQRTVEFLAVIDPIGVEGLRANIVYDTKGTCIKPSADNTMTNAEYIACIKSAERRKITSNVKHFYNRWQKDAQGPLDYQRQIPSIDSRGNVVQMPTASGRFQIENGTDADQRRVYFAGDKNAHELLLAEEAKVLPKLLVQHLR